MKIFRSVAAVLSFLSFVFMWGHIGSASAAEWTQAKPVSAIQITTSAAGAVGAYYITTIGGWGAAGCPGAVYAYLMGNLAQARELLATVMLAKAMNENVQFSGTCVDQNYFQVTIVISY
jgi:hypothetical protein